VWGCVNYSGLTSPGLRMDSKLYLRKLNERAPGTGEGLSDWLPDLKLMSSRQPLYALPSSAFRLTSVFSIFPAYRSVQLVKLSHQFQALMERLVAARVTVLEWGLVHHGSYLRVDFLRNPTNRGFELAR
jgi:hypothetical protein